MELVIGALVLALLVYLAFKVAKVLIRIALILAVVALVVVMLGRVGLLPDEVTEHLPSFLTSQT